MNPSSKILSICNIIADLKISCRRENLILCENLFSCCLEPAAVPRDVKNKSDRQNVAAVNVDVANDMTGVEISGRHQMKIEHDTGCDTGNSADEQRHIEPKIFPHENPSNKKIDETNSFAKSYHKNIFRANQPSKCISRACS